MAKGKPKATTKSTKTTKKSKAKSKLKAPKKQSHIIELKKIMTSIIVLILLVIASAFLAKFLIQNKKHTEPKKNTTLIVSKSKKNKFKEKNIKKKISFKYKTIKSKKKIKPKFEVYSNPKIINMPHRTFKKIPIKNKLPKIAIIIDDFGHNIKIAEKFLSINASITYSVLPYSNFHQEIASAVHKKGYEVMLHLPMEPFEYPDVDSGPGTIFSNMSADALIDQLNNDIKAVPYIKGVNNHMGSKITSMSTKMYQIFSILKKKNLYFIDSRTTEKTICRPSARLFHIPFGERNIFLDHNQNKKAILNQVKKLVNIANTQGFAIGIGHPYNETYEVLKGSIWDLRKKVKIVPASKLVQYVDS